MEKEIEKKRQRAFDLMLQLTPEQLEIALKAALETDESK